MSRCSADTQNGERCKNVCTSESEFCTVHTSLGECPICMENMFPRTSRIIKCNHRFHKKCLEKWKKQNKRTCPVCRSYFDCSRFKVTLSIVDRESLQVHSSNLNPEVVNTLMSGTDSNINFETITTDIIFDIDDMVELEQLISDLGTSFTNLNTSPLDAERMAETFVI